MKQKLDIEINLYKEKFKETFYLGEPIKGFLKIRAHENINVQELGVHLIKVATGEKEEIVSTHPIYTEDIISEHEIYRLPIDFINDKHESYQGKKLKITFKIKPYLITKEDGNIKDKTKEYPVNLLENNKKWATNSFLDFDIKNQKFSIAPQKTVLSHRSCFALVLYTFLFVYLFVFFVGFAMKEKSGLNNEIVMIYLIGAGIILFFTQYISKLVLGKIHLKIEETDEEHFTIYIDKEKKWKSIHRVVVYYEIEEVNNGARESGESNTNSIYRSTVHKFKPPYDDNLAIPFKYPKTAPTPLKTKNIRINWRFKLELAATFGFNYNFNWDFMVQNKL